MMSPRRQKWVTRNDRQCLLQCRRLTENKRQSEIVGIPLAYHTALVGCDGVTAYVS